MRGARKPSPRWATVAEVAELFCVSETTVLKGRGVFASLRRVSVTDNRILFLRKDVERLDRALEREAVTLDHTEEAGGLRLAG